MENIKQVIILRTDLNMRKGKMTAQGAHASMSVILKRMRDEGNDKLWNIYVGSPMDAMSKWLTGAFTKIVLGVSSLEEMDALHKQAEDAGIECSYIIDKGLTEFNNEPTPTCIAIGPDYSEKIDPITKHLKLL